jgi:hypothetical protein
MIIINLKDLYPADSQQQLTDKLNYNFNQLLRLGVGTPGPQGDDGPPGNQGIPGMPGAQGVRGSYWYSGNYSDPSLDPAMSGSPDPRNVNDCYLATATGSLAMWQYKAGSPNYWEMVVDLQQAISLNISAVSPFTRPAGSPPPPNWNSIIIPYPVPSTGLWNNTLLMSSEYQTELYTGSHAAVNSAALRNTQVALLGGVMSTIKYALTIGEVDYAYALGTPDTSNPRVRLNNALRISTRYKQKSPQAMPEYAASVFDAASFDEAQSINDATTGFVFHTRHSDAGASRIMSAYLADKRFLDGYGLNFDDVNNVDFGGFVITTATPQASAIAIGTNMTYDGTIQLVYPCGYVIANNTVKKIYVNKSWVPLKLSSIDPVNLGTYGTTSTQWDNLYLKSGIGYTDQEHLKFWRNIQDAAYASDVSNCSMTLTTAGKLAVGSSLSNYSGAGAIAGLSWGTSPATSGNVNNKAVVHIYDDVTTAPTVAMLDEAGLLVEKKWGYLDRFTGVGAGIKMGMFVHNAVDIKTGSPASPGSPSPAADLAPDATAAYIMQGQRSSDLTKGVVTNMTGLNVYAYANADAANVTDVVGVVSNMEFLLSSGTTTTRANSTIAFKAVVPTDYVTGTSGANYMRYGFYQSGATDALNMLAGHLSFGGSGSGHTITGYGAVSGHVIDVQGKAGTPLYITSAAGYAVSAGNLYLYAGYGKYGGSGGHAILRGGSTDGAENSGDVYVMAGELALSSHGKTGGNVYVSGAVCNAAGTHATVGTVFISPSVEIDGTSAIQSAGNIVIGYAKMGSALGAAYDFGSQGLVGIGTTNPAEKLHVNGNIALSANAGGTTREIYVRPGAMNGETDTHDGNGAHLRIHAGDGIKVGTYVGTKIGGSLYLTGGLHQGTAFGGAPPRTADGNVVLAHDGSDPIGRVAVRKTLSMNAVDYYADFDVHGNIRNDGDIMWGSSNATPGWVEIVDVVGSAWTDLTGIYVYAHPDSQPDAVPKEISFDDLKASGYSSVQIRAKRIGSVAFLQFAINLDFSGPLTPPLYNNNVFYIAWDPTAVGVAALGKFNRTYNTSPTPSTGIEYRRSVNPANLNAQVYDGVADYIPCESLAGYNAGAYGDIPGGRNVISFSTGSVTGGTRYVIGSGIVEMETTDVSST